MNPPALPALDMVPLLNLALTHFALMLRVGAFLTAAPLFGARYVPLQLRIVLAFALPLPLSGQVPLPAPDALASLSAVPLILGELALGLVAGTVLMVMISAAAFAGDRIANTAGLGFAAQFDPAAGAQTPVVSQIFTFGQLMIFVTTDGHLRALDILLRSYISHPPGSGFNPDLLMTGIKAGGQLFALGLSLSLPLVGLLLILNLGVGVLTRSAPQFNVFSFGFPLTMAATMLMLFISAPRLGDGFRHVVDESLSAMSQALEPADGR